MGNAKDKKFQAKLENIQTQLASGMMAGWMPTPPLLAARFQLDEQGAEEAMQDLLATGFLEKNLMGAHRVKEYGEGDILSRFQRSVLHEALAIYRMIQCASAGEIGSRGVIVEMFERLRSLANDASSYSPLSYLRAECEIFGRLVSQYLDPTVAEAYRTEAPLGFRHATIVAYRADRIAASSPDIEAIIAGIEKGWAINAMRHHRRYRRAQCTAVTDQLVKRSDIGWTAQSVEPIALREAIR